MEGLLEEAELNSAGQRQQAHLLLDVLSAEKLSAVHGLLGVRAQPLTLAMDPELTNASLDQGEFVSNEEMCEFGLL